MKPISCLFFILLILTLWPRRIITNDRVPNTVSDAIKKACETTPYKELCLSSMKDDCESPNASDLHQVAGIAVKLAYLNATDTKEHMKVLIHNGTVMDLPFVEQCLHDCSTAYGDAISDLEDAVVAFEANGSYTDIENWVEAAMGDPQTCENYFKEVPGQTSPLTDRNTMLVQLCRNALAIVKQAATVK